MPKYNDQEVPQFPLLPAGTFRFKIERENGLVHGKTPKGVPRTQVVMTAKVVAPQQYANLTARNFFVLGNERDPNGALPETKATSVAWRRWRELRNACDVPSLGSTEEEALAMSGKEFIADISRRVYKVEANNPDSELRPVNDFGRFYKVGTAEPRILEVSPYPTGETAPASSTGYASSAASARRAALEEE